MTTYGYDAAGRLASLANDLAGAVSDVTLSFTRNLAGELASRTTSNAAYVATQASAAVSYTPNGLNQLSSVAGVAMSYDTRGNLANEGVALG